MTKFLDTIKRRRSIYGLGKNVALSDTEIEDIVKEAVKIVQLRLTHNHQEP